MSVHVDLCEICYADVKENQAHQPWCALGLAQARADTAEARVTELEAVCAYWLRDARFLVSDYSADGEYRRAVHALENGRLE